MSKKSVLLVDDSPEDQLIIRKTLETSVNLTCVSTAELAAEKLESETYHLILLDLQLPDDDGINFCASLKEQPRTAHIPIVMITGNTNVQVQVRGFSAGAEDYIKKPFNPLELRARVMAKLRNVEESNKRKTFYYFAELCINTDLHKAFKVVDGKEIDLELTPVECKLLIALTKSVGKPLHRDELLAAVWGDQENITNRVVDRHISALRSKLGAFGKNIETVSGVGYEIKEPPKT